MKKKPKAVPYRLITPNGPDGVRLYPWLHELLEAHHQDVMDAKFALAWHVNWKPDDDGRLMLGQCRKSSDLEREIQNVSAFDFVILDPPYFHLNANEKGQLLRQAAFIARERVIWFHTIWIYSARSLPMERAWLVRVGDNCAVRCLQVFAVHGMKDRPVPLFLRGPAMKYNRWLAGQTGLPFREAV